MTIYNSITEIFGNTPLLRINKITDGAAGNVFAKLEFYNPTSSVKDRLGVAMIDAAEASGALKPGGTIVEATSGNTGIAVAMVAAARGYKAIMTMPESVSKERRKLISAYGAELVLTPAAEGMKGAVAAAEKLGESGAVLVRQFENEAGPFIHRTTTGNQVHTQSKESVQTLFRMFWIAPSMTRSWMHLMQMHLSMPAVLALKKDSLLEFHQVQPCGQHQKLQSVQSLLARTLLSSLPQMVSVIFQQFFTKI